MATATHDAIELLTTDHDNVKKLFKEYEDLGEKAYTQKRKLADKICRELQVHAQIEEEILYPLFTQSTKEKKALANEAIVEHASAKQLISLIEQTDSENELFDARVKVLSEYINHHVREEEEEMFPELRATGIDLVKLADELKARKQELI